MRPYLFFGLILLSIFFPVCIKTTAQSPSYQWAKAIGGNSYDIGNAMAVDKETGDIYTTGVFSASVDFDPGREVYNLTSEGDNDIFILKTNTYGQFVWAKSLGGSINDAGHSIAIDASGNVYVTGQFSKTVDFDPGEGIFTLTSAGSVDIFVLKLDRSGNFIWAKVMGGDGYDVGKSLAVDPSGSEDIYIKGEFSGTVDFDPGKDSFNLTTSRISNGIFISKLDSYGNFIWAEKVGEAPKDGTMDMAPYCGYGQSIVVDVSGFVYTTGWFQGAVDFDPGTGEYQLTATGINDIFILKLDAFGKFVWALSMEGTPKGAGHKDVRHSLAVDALGNLYTTGTFQGTVDFDPGNGTHHLTARGAAFGDIYISKLDSDGHFIWAKTFGGPGSDRGNSIAVDPISGDIYTIGNFTRTVDFDPGNGIFNLTSAGDDDFDVFISKLDHAGNFVWAKALGGTRADYGYSIALNGLGNIHVVGGFTGPTISFGLTTLTNPVSINNHLEIFIAKLNVSIPEPDIDEQLVDVYPNPVKDLLKVKYHEEVVTEVNVKMYNLSGAIVFSDTYKNLNEFSIDVSSFAAASYFIELNNGKHRAVKQVVKAEE